MKMLGLKVNELLQANRHKPTASFNRAQSCIGTAVVVLACATLTACQTTAPEITSFAVRSDTPIGQTMPRLVTLANKCLVGKGTPFPGYRVSSELNSLSGQPRLLLVRANNTQGLPGLVILGQERNGGTAISVFGRLLGEPGARSKVTANVTGWAEGSSSCA